LIDVKHVRMQIGGSRAMGAANDGYAARPNFQNANALIRQ